MTANNKNNNKMILLVCSGNTCRSPMAKVILEQMLKADGLENQFKIDSAACDVPGLSVHPNARQAIKEMYGIDALADHKPKKKTKAMEDKADLIIVMEHSMKDGLPERKTIAFEIPDPIGSDVKGYKECAEAIKQSFTDIYVWKQIYEVIPSFFPPPGVSFKFNMMEFLKKHGQQPRFTADWVYREALKIAEKVNYGRGDHPLTVTRLMRDRFCLLMVDTPLEAGL